MDFLLWGWLEKKLKKGLNKITISIIIVSIRAI